MDSPRPSRARIEEEREAAGNVDDNDSPGTVSEGAEAADEGDTLVLICHTQFPKDASFQLKQKR